MRSYKSLIIISKVFKFIAYLNLILALVLAPLYFIVLNGSESIAETGQATGIAILMMVGVILLGLMAFVFWLALSQLVMLMVNVADDVFNIATNVYAIANEKD